MTIITGSKILSADYNALVSRTNKIFADNYPTSAPTQSSIRRALQAYGWGNTEASTVNVGTKVSAELVNEIVDRLNISSEHVGGQYELDRVVSGQKITASIWNDLDTVLLDIDPKKNIAAAGQTALSVLGNISHTTGFNGVLTYTTRLSFDNYEKARYFFNSGSSIRLNLSTIGGNNLAASWAHVYDRLGTVTFGLDNTLSTTANIISEGKGFEDLNDVDQLLLTVNCRGGSGGSYGYGYGYGYGNCYDGYGYGYGYGYGSYGYGNGGGSQKIRIYGRVVTTGSNYVNGPVQLILTVQLSCGNTSQVTGTHTLHVEGNKATPKTSGSASFNITGPSYSGSSTA